MIVETSYSLWLLISHASFNNVIAIFRIFAIILRKIANFSCKKIILFSFRVKIKFWLGGNTQIPLKVKVQLTRDQGHHAHHHVRLYSIVKYLQM